MPIFFIWYNIEEHFERKMKELISKIVETVTSGKGVEVVDIELVNHAKHPAVRIFIDRPGGITVKECALINRELSTNFLVEDSIPDNMVIEVSSPGLDRILKKERDFTRNMGRDLEVFYRAEGRQFDRVGKLIEVSPVGIKLISDKGELTVSYQDIVKAKVHIKF